MYLEQSNRLPLQLLWVSGALATVEREGLSKILKVVEGFFQIIWIDLHREGGIRERREGGREGEGEREGGREREREGREGGWEEGSFNAYG